MKNIYKGSRRDTLVLGSELETISEFATRVLFSEKLEDKLRAPKKLIDIHQQHPLVRIPEKPHRDHSLPLLTLGENKRSKRDLKPTLERLEDPLFRGRILHTFAHHELISLELMALALLRFTSAPRPFRRGLAKVMIDEQVHFGLYLSRIKELGLELGEEPVSDYFWRCVAHSPDLPSFNARLGLVFEQANIDFTRHYGPLFQQCGDEASAKALDQIYQDEISHVGFGLHWFRKWRPNNEPEWDSFCQLLEPPLSPGRAKGTVFSVIGRRAAGFSEEYIQSLKLWGGSTGRPPIVWFGNFDFEDELKDEATTKGLLPKDKSPKRRSAQKKIRITSQQSFAPILSWLCTRGDIVFSPNEIPTIPFQQLLQKARGINPEWVLELDKLCEKKLGGVSPWGWSQTTIKKLDILRSSILESGQDFPDHHTLNHIQTCSTKLWDIECREDLRQALRKDNELCPIYLPKRDQVFIVKSEDDILKLEEWLEGSSQDEWVAKRAFGQAGRGLKRWRKGEPFDQPLISWLKRSLPLGVVIEPWMNRQADLSFHGFVDKTSIKYDGEVLGLVDKNGRFQGAYLGPPASGLDINLKRFLNGDGHDRRRLSRIGKVVIQTIGKLLQSYNYHGPFGVDAMIIADQSGSYFLQPLLEINPRFTMGRLALALRHIFDPRGQLSAKLHFVPSINSLEKSIVEKLVNPNEYLWDKRGKWQGGYLPINDIWQVQKSHVHGKTNQPIVYLSTRTE